MVRPFWVGILYLVSFRPTAGKWANILLRNQLKTQKTRLVYLGTRNLAMMPGIRRLLSMSRAFILWGMGLFFVVERGEVDLDIGVYI